MEKEPIDYLLPEKLFDYCNNKIVPKLIRFFLLLALCAIWLPIMLIISIPIFIWQMWVDID